MNLISSLIRSAFVLCFALFAGQVPATQLDQQLGESGFRRLTELGGVDHVPLGSCPHADGSLSLVFNRQAMPTVAIARMLSTGALDTGFGDGGMSSIYLGTMLRGSDLAVACQNTTNADPADDRMLLASRRLDESGESLTFLTIDLNTQSAAQIEINLLPMLLRDDGPVYTQIFVRGLHPVAGGGWLVTGSVYNDDVAGASPAAFILRIGAGNEFSASLPATAQLAMLELNAAYLASDGYIRAIGRASTAGGQTWALLKLNASTLLPVSAVNGTPVADDFLLHHGRVIGADLLVIGASRHVPFEGLLAQPAAQAPRMLIARLDQVNELVLPAVPELAGNAQSLIASAAAAAVTSASGGRAVFVGNLARPDRPRTGTYVAMVKLGNGSTIADRIDFQFGNQGADAFAFRPPNGLCAATDTPVQWVGNISSWGANTALIGATHMACPTSQPTYLYAARVLTVNPDVVLNDSFE